MIQMFHVTKVYQTGTVALDDVTVRIEKGEFAFLIGPTGSGKTTFMRLIYREVTPSEGNVVIDGRNVERLAAYKIPYLRRSVGVVFQDFKLLPHRTVFENVAFALRVMEVPQIVLKNQVTKALELVGVSHKKRMYPDQLSGGEKQRVCIARAIVNEPAILLTDEPTGNLDPMMSWEIMKVLHEINLKGTTVLMATHNKDIVDKMKRRVIVLKDGKIVKDDPRGGFAYD
jgi:cell division transport system ATP-binding protein